MLSEARIFVQIVVLMGITVVNFSWWYYVGTMEGTRSHCPTLPAPSYTVPPIEVAPTPSFPFRLDLVLSSELVKYRDNALLNIRLPTWSLLLDKEGYCQRFVHIQTSSKRLFSCLALSHAQVNASYNLLRYEDFTPPLQLLREREEWRRRNEDTFAKQAQGKDLEEKEGEVEKGGEKGEEGEEKGEEREEKEEKGGKKREKERGKGEEAAPLNATGFFGNVANLNGRRLLDQKMSQFLSHHSSLRSHILQALDEGGIRRGGQVLVLVMNDGEIELFVNLLCSLRQHQLGHLIRKMVVFTSSLDIVSYIEAFGVLAMHHAAFPLVSRHSSFEYLDPIFIEMMWYKSFSVYILLALGYDVLFQDVDIVYFQDPFPYFLQVQQQRNASHKAPIDAFLSDDGQRSLRYAPFYANSGYYFLVSNEKTVYFAYSIMISFDLLHITGSHQNIYTLRLLEALDFYYLSTFFLPMGLFPSGVKFSHDRPYMRAIQDHHEHPYIFHMCWTKNKEHKLKNFHEAKMWYINDEASQHFLQLEEKNTELSKREREEGKKGELRVEDNSVFMRKAKEIVKRERDREKRFAVYSEAVCAVDEFAA